MGAADNLARYAPRTEGLDVIAKQTGHRSLTTLMGYIRRAVELSGVCASHAWG